MKPIHYFKLVLCLCVLAAFLINPGGKLSASTTGCIWQVVASPTFVDNELLSVAAVSASDIWAVGDYVNNGIELTLIEHWNGTNWQVVSSPSPDPHGNDLYGVAVVSANDVWAVGYYNNGYPQSLIEHWDGSQWSVVPSPKNTGPLYSVAVVSASDIWAVGYNSVIPTHTLIEHWDGSQWSVVPSPNPSATHNYLYSVATVSASNVWAVGFEYEKNNAYRTLIEHWNGKRWARVHSPNHPGYLPDSNYLYGVAAVSASNVWTVGAYHDNHNFYTLIEQWNGSQWSRAPRRYAGQDAELTGVAAVSTSDAWAVGTTANFGRTLTEHWNGTWWSVMYSPNVGTNRNSLYGVAAVSANAIWAVGLYRNSNGNNQALIEFHC